MNKNIKQVFGHYIDIDKIKSKFIIVDGGACMGELNESLTPYLSGTDYRLYGFECCKSNFKFLEKNNNKIITYYENALVGEHEEEEIEFMEVVSNNNKFKEWGNVKGLYENYLMHDSEFIKTIKYKVKTLKINSLLNFLKIDSIDYLKLDTEGTEYDIVTDMNEETAKKISQISMEIHFEKKEQDILLKKLYSLGFSFHKFKVEEQNVKSNELYVSR